MEAVPIISQHERLAAMAAKIQDDIRESWVAGRNRTKYRPSGNYASKAAHACAWFLWALRERWEEIPPPDLDLLGIFKTGSEIETAVVADLRAAGYTVTHQQVAFEDEDLQLRGRIDGYLHSAELAELVSQLRGKPVGHSWQGVPLEIKGLHPNYHGDCTSFMRMLSDKRPWVRTAPGQVLLYAYMDRLEQPLVAMALRDKASRRTTVLLELLDDHMGELERIGETLAEVNRCIREGTEPKPIQYQPSWCERCDAAPICPTAMHVAGGGKVDLATGPLAEELETLAKTKLAKHEAKLQHDRADKAIKTLLEKTGHWPATPGAVETVVCGQHRVTVKTTGTEKSPRRSLDVVALGTATKGEADEAGIGSAWALRSRRPSGVMEKKGNAKASEGVEEPATPPRVCGPR